MTFLVLLVILFFTVYQPLKNKVQTACISTEQQVVHTAKIGDTTYNNMDTFRKNLNGSFTVDHMLNGKFISSDTIFKDAKDNIYLGNYKIATADGNLVATTEPNQMTFSNFYGQILVKNPNGYKLYYYVKQGPNRTKSLDDAITAKDAIFLDEIYIGEKVSVVLSSGEENIAILQNNGQIYITNSKVEVSGSTIQVSYRTNPFVSVLMATFLIRGTIVVY